MAEKQRILIVDDDANIAELISLYLMKECYETMIVGDGEEALRVFPDFKPNLVLLDLMLPGMDGYQVCRELRTSSQVPIIMLSAKSTDLDKILGLGTGADDYVVKPFNPLELTARVKSQLRHQGYGDQQGQPQGDRGRRGDQAHPHRVRHSLSPGLQPRQGVQHGRDLREGLEREGLRGEQYRYGTYQKAERQAEGGHQTEQNHYDSVGSRIQN